MSDLAELIKAERSAADLNADYDGGVGTYADYQNAKAATDAAIAELAAQVVPQPNRDIGYWQDVIEAGLVENGVGYEREDWFTNVIFSAAEAVTAILSTQPVEGEVEWEWGVARKRWPSTPAYYYRNREECERFTEHPPLGIPNPHGPWLILRRRKAGPWTEVQP